MSKSEMPHKYILVGPSGVGKNTMAERLEELGLERCITCTSRPPRPGELEKQTYYFVDSFAPLSMFEQAEFGGYKYGITNDELRKGDFVILEPQGVDFYRKNYPGPLTVIALQRDGIHVDPERRARDAAAGFDKVNPDITVYGETIPDMKENLVAAMFSYEMQRLRDTGASPISHLFCEDVVYGSVSLTFTEATFGLPVCSEQSHMDYREDPAGYDGIFCFESANYRALFDAFSAMTEKGQDCFLDLRLHNEKQNTLYFARLRSEEGRVEAELYPDHLDMEPCHFVTKSAKDALAAAYGGFVAAEADLLSRAISNPDDVRAVKHFRDSISAGRFELHSDSGNSRHPTLASRIRHVETDNKIRLQKLFDAPSQDYNFPDR